MNKRKKTFQFSKKRLGIEKDLLNYLKVEKEFNDYSKNHLRRLEEKREQVKKHFSKVRDKLRSWSETRKNWIAYDIPKYDNVDFFNLSEQVENFLKDTCKTETQEAFYKV